MIRILILSLLCVASFAAETSVAKVSEQPAMQAVATTPDDLQNLSACARMALPSLTPEQMSVVAVAIKHAETDIATMHKAQAEMPEPPKDMAKKP